MMTMMMIVKMIVAVTRMLSDIHLEIIEESQRDISGDVLKRNA